MRVERIASSYQPAAKGGPGTFRSGQSADLVLGAFGFNQSGGPLALNHPTGLATDGIRLLVADRWNNRVLIWTQIPASNEPPQLVLGQPGFNSNDPGLGPDQLNWPGNVSVAQNGRLAVTDTNNDRILLWNSFPVANGQPADLELRLESFRSPEDRMQPGWPWGVWTDGTKLAVVATRGAAVLIWNAWPATPEQRPDLVLRPSDAGTPRNITSDGTFLMLSDHNHKGSQRPGPHGPPPPPRGPGQAGGGMPGGAATQVWNTWPASPDQAPDYVLPEWRKGTPAAGGGLILADLQSISIWNRRPLDASARPDVRLQPRSYRNGDGPDAIVAAGRLFVCNYNGSNILAWNNIPKADTPPDFALGSKTPDEDVWSNRFWIQNPIVATDGTSLFASSDFDRKLFVWRKLPGESGAHPDLVYHLPQGPWDNAVHGTNLILGGRDTLYVWRTLPLDGQLPDLTLQRRNGSVELREFTGVAIDAKNVYVADRGTNRVSVWKGIPTASDQPVQVLDVSNPGRMSSDGTWLTIAPFEGQEIVFYKVDDLSAPPVRLGGRGKFNLPGKAIIADGRLFVADTSFHRIDVWNDVNDALTGAPADAYLGARDETDRGPGIGQAGLFMPGSMAHDGANLWVGEFKFSTRILRFPPTGR